jgi:hypothetical protein
MHPDKKQILSFYILGNVVSEQHKFFNIETRFLLSSKGFIGIQTNNFRYHHFKTIHILLQDIRNCGYVFTFGMILETNTSARIVFPTLGYDISTAFSFDVEPSYINRCTIDDF